MTLAQVRAALASREEEQAAGPRSIAGLARACGVSLSSLHQALDGKRPMPATMRAAIMGALPELA